MESFLLTVVMIGVFIVGFLAGQDFRKFTITDTCMEQQMFIGDEGKEFECRLIAIDGHKVLEDDSE